MEAGLEGLAGWGSGGRGGGFGKSWRGVTRIFAFTVRRPTMPHHTAAIRPLPLVALMFGAALAAPLATPITQAALAGDQECPCLGDLNGDGLVDAADLAILLGEWGQTGPVGDLSFSELVDAEDLAILLGAWGACPSVPVNDACGSPISIGATFVEVPFCTVNAATSLSAASACGSLGNLEKDIFYRFVAPQTGRYRVKIYDATFDARAIVYNAPTIQSVCGAAQGNPAVLGCTIDAVPDHIVPSVDGHAVEFDLVENQPIMIRIGSPSGAIGYGSLMVERVLPGWSPCEPLAFFTGGGGGSTSIGTFDKTYPTVSTSGCYAGKPMIQTWYTFESACSQNFDLRISTCQGFQSMDCVLSLFVGSCGELFEVDCADDTCTDSEGVLGEEIVFKDCTPNTKYFIRIMAYPGAQLDQYGLSMQVLTTCP